MRRQNKAEVVAGLRDKLGQACVVIVAQAFGLDSGQTFRLRKAIRQAGGELKVAKNTLARIAARESGYRDLEGVLSGPTALVLGYRDPVAVAKALVEFSSEAGERVVIKGAVLQGRALGASEVKELASLPPREVLVASLLGLLQAPAAQLLRLLQEPGARLVRLLERRREQLESSAG
ncbi:MAG: 50S ribosomal protein L10 [Candidatus Binatia bacterium]|nr:MAG: 50S ribosomal protein L10 [Candidatus Binatia bacterium]